MLYDHFRQKFDDLVADHVSDSEMTSEREVLSATNRIVRDKCVIEEAEYSKLPKIYRVVQLDFTTKIEIFYMMFNRSLSIFAVASLCIELI